MYEKLVPVLFFAIFTESGCSDDIISGISFIELNDLTIACLFGSSNERRSSCNLMSEFSLSAGSLIPSEIRNADSTSSGYFSAKEIFYDR